MTIILPAIIAADENELIIKIREARHYSEIVQLDVLDGITVPGVQSWPYTDLKSFEKYLDGEEGLPGWKDVSFEVHLMIRSPEKYVYEWISAGVSSIVAHPAFSRDVEELWRICSESSIPLWHAISPLDASSPEKVISTAQQYLELFNRFYGDLTAEDLKAVQGGIQVMGNDKIGKHGVELDPCVFGIITNLRKHGIEHISVDIGVQEDTWKDLIDAGATKLISGSMLSGIENPQSLVREIQEYHYDIL